MDYVLAEGEWSSSVLPSEVIMATRAKQMQDHEAIETLLDVSADILKNLEEGLIKERMTAAYDAIKSGF